MSGGTSGGSLVVRRLYRQLMREAQSFPDFNFRHYFLRRIQFEYKQKLGLTFSSSDEVAREVEKGQAQLDMLRRQAVVGQLFDTKLKLAGVEK